MKVLIDAPSCNDNTHNHVQELLRHKASIVTQHRVNVSETGTLCLDMNEIFHLNKL